MLSEPTFTRSRVLTAVAVVLFAIAFWELRFLYWATTFEQPFSDISLYVWVAQEIRNNFFFANAPSLYAYNTPVTPGFIALSMLAAGDHYTSFFRVAVQAITFSATLLLAFELAAWTRNRVLGLSLLFIVALSRPSIFWSLKLGTEGLSEALLLLSAGLILRAFRMRSVTLAGLAGVSGMLLALNRPQFLSGLFVAGAVFLLSALVIWLRERSGPGAEETPGRLARLLRRLNETPPPTLRARSLQVACFAIGIAIVWTPWIVRNYAHYGAFIPTATSGVDTLIWDYGTEPVRVGRYERLPVGPNDSLPLMGVKAITGPLHDSVDDYKTAQVVSGIYRAWLKANWMDFPRVYFWRLKNLIAERGPSGLTTVPRETLFPVDVRGWNYRWTAKRWLDVILLDKTPWMVMLGFAGVILFAFRFGFPGFMVASLTMLPWLTLPLVLGHERIVESMIPITMWFSVYCAFRIVAASLGMAEAAEPEAHAEA